MPQPWNAPAPPRKILTIRLQAMGDMVITLPYLQGLRAQLPAGTQLDFLTREEVSAIPEALQLFRNVYTLGGGRNEKLQLLHAALLLPRLLFNGYDAVLDLQNNRLSNIVRKALRPAAGVTFDRFSPQSAGERNRQTIEAIGMGGIEPVFKHPFKRVRPVEQLLLANGWQPGHPLVVLNPAGAFENRNWPLDHYAAFARQWKERFSRTRFLIMGIGKTTSKAAALKSLLGADLIDLTEKTTAADAFALIQKAVFVLSEDSGLMHMAWVNGVPTLALFGSTRSDWSRPLGPHSAFLDSADLPCGHCMLERCRHGGIRENECMKRYTPELVFETALALLERIGSPLLYG